MSQSNQGLGSAAPLAMFRDEKQIRLLIEFPLCVCMCVCVCVCAKFESIRYFIDIDILQNCLNDISKITISISIFSKITLSISISISIFLELPYRYRYRYRYFQLLHIDIDIDIDIFQKCRYIDNRYVITIYRTGLSG